MDPAAVDRLSGIDDLDAGEVVLFKGGALRDRDLVVTGDKRAIRALHAAAEAGIAAVSEVVDKLEGRVVSVEQVFRRLVIRYGSELVYAHKPLCSVDTVLDIVIRPNRQQTLAGLNSYIASLRAEVGRLLCAN